MEIGIEEPGPVSAAIALGFFGEHYAAVFPRVRELYGIAIDPEAALRRDASGLAKYYAPSGRMLVARSEGRPLGIACLVLVGPGVGEVKHVYVRPEARGLGVGRRLMEVLIDEARAMGLAFLRLDSGRFQTPAHALYRGLGFAEVPKYPESAVGVEEEAALLFMEKRL